MPTNRDHIMNAVVPIDGGRKLYVVGGRTYRGAGGNPLLWKTVSVAELHDIQKGKWTEVMRSPYFPRRARLRLWNSIVVERIRNRRYF